MKLVTLIGYPSNSSGEYETRDNSDWTAYKLVCAIKHKTFQMYADIPTNNGAIQRIENTPDGRRKALEIVSKIMAGKIKKHFETETATLVPVPSSSYVEIGQAFTGKRICDAIENVHSGYHSQPSLIFTEPVQKAAEGGPRNPNDLVPLMAIAGNIPGEPVIIIDDVVSTCGHVKAAARVLEAAGYEVIGAICLAQTELKRPEKILMGKVREINIHNWPTDDDTLF